MWNMILTSLFSAEMEVLPSLLDPKQGRFTGVYRKSVVHRIQACVERDSKRATTKASASQPAEVWRFRSRTWNYGFRDLLREANGHRPDELSIHLSMQTHQAFQNIRKESKSIIQEMLEALAVPRDYPAILGDEVLSALDIFCERNLTENIWRQSATVAEPMTLMDISAAVWKQAGLMDKTKSVKNNKYFHRTAVLEFIAALESVVKNPLEVTPNAYSLMENIFRELDLVEVGLSQTKDVQIFERLKRRIERQLLIQGPMDNDGLLKTEDQRRGARLRVIHSLSASHLRLDQLTEKVLLGLNQLDQNLGLLRLNQQSRRLAFEGWMREANILRNHASGKNTGLAIKVMEGLVHCLKDGISEADWLQLSDLSSASLKWMDVASLVWHLTDPECLTPLRQSKGWASYMRRQFLESFSLFQMDKGGAIVPREEALDWMGTYLFKLVQERTQQSFLSKRLFSNIFKGLKEDILRNVSQKVFPSTNVRQRERVMRMGQRSSSIRLQENFDWQPHFNNFGWRSHEVQKRLQRIEFEFLENGLGTEEVLKAVQFWVDAAEKMAQEETERGTDFALGALRGLGKLLASDCNEEWLLHYPLQIFDPLSLAEILTLLKHAIQHAGTEPEAVRKVLRLLEAAQESPFELLSSHEENSVRRNVPLNLVEHLMDVFRFLMIAEWRESDAHAGDSILSRLTPPERMRRLTHESEMQIQSLSILPKNQRMDQSQSRLAERQAAVNIAQEGPDYHERSIESIMISPVRRHVLAALNQLENLYGSKAFGPNAVLGVMRAIHQEAQSMFQEGGLAGEVALAMMYGFPNLSPSLTEEVLGVRFSAPLNLPEVLSLVWHASMDTRRTHSSPKQLQRGIIRALAESQASRTDHNQGRLHFAQVSRLTACCPRGFLIRLVDCLNGLHEAVVMTVVTQADMSAALGKAIEALSSERRESILRGAQQSVEDFLFQALREDFPSLEAQRIQEFVNENVASVHDLLSMYLGFSSSEG